MANIDRLGRRRQPGQQRGLRSLFPTLPSDCQSRLMRVAMSGGAWTRLDVLVAASMAPTAPRAIGALIEQWLASHADTVQAAAGRTVPIGAPPAERDFTNDWQDWQMRKELALLASVRSSTVDRPTVH
jgi:hypothetical protein